MSGFPYRRVHLYYPSLNIRDAPRTEQQTNTKHMKHVKPNRGTHPTIHRAGQGSSQQSEPQVNQTTPCQPNSAPKWSQRPVPQKPQLYVRRGDRKYKYIPTAPQTGSESRGPSERTNATQPYGKSRSQTDPARPRKCMHKPTTPTIRTEERGPSVRTPAPRTSTCSWTEPRGCKHVRMVA